MAWPHKPNDPDAEVRRWLKLELRDGPRPKLAIYSEGQTVELFTVEQIRRAARRLKVEAYRDETERWMWMLPEDRRRDERD